MNRRRTKGKGSGGRSGQKKRGKELVAELLSDEVQRKPPELYPDYPISKEETEKKAIKDFEKVIIGVRRKIRTNMINSRFNLTDENYTFPLPNSEINNSFFPSELKQISTPKLHVLGDHILMEKDEETEQDQNLEVEHDHDGDLESIDMSDFVNLMASQDDEMYGEVERIDIQEKRNKDDDILPPPKKKKKVESKPVEVKKPVKTPAKIIKTPQIVDIPPIIKSNTKQNVSVVRYQPSGGRTSANGHITITFNQQMIELSTVSESDKKIPKVTITPAHEGEWRWTDTKMLKFRPKKQWKNNQYYNIKVLKGLKAVSGGELTYDYAFSFRVEPVRIYSFFGQSWNTSDPLMGVTFNVSVENFEEILKEIKIKKQGEKDLLQVEIVPIKVVKKIIEDPIFIKEHVHNIGSYKTYSNDQNSYVSESKVMFFKFKKKLPLKSSFRMDFYKQYFNFTTYGDFTKTSLYPRDSDRPTKQSTHFSFNFSNPFNKNPDSRIPIKIEIKPDLPRLKTTRSEYDKKSGKWVNKQVDREQYTISTNSITIYGQPPHGNTEYTITISNLEDIFGQKIKEKVKHTFKIYPLPWKYSSTYKPVNVIDSSRPYNQVFSLLCLNVKKVKVEVFHVKPDNLDTYLYNSNNGKKFKEFIVNTEAKLDEETVFNYPLEWKLLQHPRERVGGIVLLITGNEYLSDKPYYSYSSSQKVRHWFQFTKMALDTFAFPKRITYACVNSLKDGTFLKGAKFFNYGMKPFKSTVDGNVYKLELDPNSNSNSIVVAKVKNDVCFLQNVYTNSGCGHTGGYRTFVFDDRKIYKPGDTCQIKGLIRLLIPKGSGYEVTFPKFDKDSIVKYEVKDPRYQSFMKKENKVTKTGAFSFPITFSKDAKMLGNYSINFNYRGYTFSHSVKVEEFKTPPFIVSVATQNIGTTFLDDKIKVSLNANYMDYSPVKGAKTTWKMRKEIFNFTPKRGYYFYNYEYQGRYGGRHGKFYGRGRRSYYNPILDWTTIESKTNSMGESTHEFDLSSLTGGGGGSSHGLFSLTRITKIPKRSKSKATFNRESCYTVHIEGSVQDADKTTINGGTSIKLYPTELYVGLKLKKYTYNTGQIFGASFIVVDKDGYFKSGVDVDLEIIDLKDNAKSFYKKKFKSSNKAVEFIDIQKKTLKQFEKEGNFKIICRIVDSKKRTHSCSSTFRYNKRKEAGVDKIEREEVSLVANKEEFEIGDVAKILIESPFDPKTGCTGVLFGATSGVTFAKTFTMKKKNNNMIVVDVPLKDEYFMPNLKLYCTLYGQKTSKKLDKVLTSYGYGDLSLKIALGHRIVNVKVTPSKTKYGPAEMCELNVKIGKALKGVEITLIVVDKAVLSLTGYELTNPIANFYPSHSCNMTMKYLREFIMMKIVDLKEMEKIRDKCKECEKKCCRCEEECCCSCCKCSAPCCCRKRCCKPKKKCCGGRGRSEKSKEMSAPPKKAITFRSDFNPLAYFAASIIPDKNMSAKVKFKLPDSLTTYTVWALVANEKNYGLGDSEFITDKDFTAEARFPQFLNYGDKMDLQIMLANKMNVQKDIIVFVVFDGKINFQSHMKKKEVHVSLKANKRTIVKVPIISTNLGMFKIKVIAKVKNSTIQDAFEETIEVIRPQTLESFCQYGELAKEKDECSTALKIPMKSIFPDVGGISLAMSSTAISQLTDCFLYLYNYKFNCAEQISSKVFGVCTVGFILEQFNIPNFPKSSLLKDVLQEATKKYFYAQRNDGGFGFWSSAKHSWPYVSLYVIHAMLLIKQSGRTAVNQTMLEKAKGYCKLLLQQKNEYFDRDWRWYQKKTRYTTRAFNTYIFAHFYELKMIDKHEMSKVVEEAISIFEDSEDESENYNQLGLDGFGWLLYAIGTCSDKKIDHPIAKKILQKLNNAVNETAQTMNFVTNYSRSDMYVMLSSSRKTDGILLEILCHLQVKEFMPLMPKLVKGLLAHRIKGKHWRNTQENKFILLGIKKYFDVFEKDVPNFVVKYSLPKSKQSGESKFRGRETKTETFEVPVSKLKDKDDCVIKKEGKGRLYYRLGIKYSPKNLQLEAKDRGMKIRQEYEGINNKKHLKKDKKGTYTLTNGELFRVKVFIETETRRYHTAVVVNIPAGCELLNPNLKTTGIIPQDPIRNTYYTEHKNYRKDRFEGFRSSVEAGKYYISFVMRANNSGTFVVPPVYIEEMYAPEVFGRGKTLNVCVK